MQNIYVPRYFNGSISECRRISDRLDLGIHEKGSDPEIGIFLISNLHMESPYGVHKLYITFIHLFTY